MSASEQSDDIEPCINPNQILPKQFRHNKNTNNQDSAIFEEDETTSSHSRVILTRSPENPVSPHNNDNCSQLELLQRTKSTIDKAINFNKSLETLSQEARHSSISSVLPRLNEKITESDSFFSETNAENLYSGQVPLLDFQNVEALTGLVKNVAIRSQTETSTQPRFKFNWKTVANKIAGEDGENTIESWMKAADRFCIHPRIGPEFTGFMDNTGFASNLLESFNDDDENEQPKEKRVRQTRIVSHKEESANKNDQYESNLNGENDQISHKILDTMTKVIDEQITKNGGEEVDYMKLMLDGKSFAHTVENIFHFSFLVRKEIFGLRIDEKTGIYWIFKPDPRKEPCRSMRRMEFFQFDSEDENENDVDDGPVPKRPKPQQTRQYVPAEAIFNITMGDWRELVEVLNYENVKNLLP